MNKKTGKWYEERASLKPKDVDGLCATRTEHYIRELVKIVKGRFDITCPDDWDIDLMLNMLIYNGFFCLTNSVLGVIPLRGSLTGINYNSLATKAVFTAPGLVSWEESINKGCVVIYLERIRNNYFYAPIRSIEVTAEKLASADANIDINLINTRPGYLIEAETKAQAQAIKTAYDKISNGEPIVVHRSNALNTQIGNGAQMFFGDIKNRYIANDMYLTKSYIMYEFLSFWGINNANINKKERLITNEVEANNEQIECGITHWKKILERQVGWVHKVFPDLDFDMKLTELSEEEASDATDRLVRDMGYNAQG